MCVSESVSNESVSQSVCQCILMILTMGGANTFHPMCMASLMSPLTAILEWPCMFAMLSTIMMSLLQFSKIGKVCGTFVNLCTCNTSSSKFITTVSLVHYV